MGTAVFAGMLLLRIVALSKYLAVTVTTTGGGDIAFYGQWAQRILAGQLTDGGAFPALPLYAYWLAAFRGIFGPSPFLPALIQCGADAGTALLLFKITAFLAKGWEIGEVDLWPPGFGRSVATHRAEITGALAALGWAFFLPAQAFSIVQMPTVLGVFVFWFLVWQVIGRSEAPRRAILLLLGLLLGVTAMAVATVLFLLPFLIVALLWKWRPCPDARWASRAIGTLLLLGGVTLGTAPCWLHNTLVAKDPVFLSAHGGINFWIGNNPNANGYPRFGEVRAGQAEMLHDSVVLAEKAAGKPLKRGQVSTFWSTKARVYIASDFPGWLRLLGRKIWNFWNAFQYDDLSVIAKLREAGVILPGIGFGLIAALALAAIPFVLRASPGAHWILAAVGLQMLALLPVFITERYRLAAVPGLLILAVLGLWHLWQSNVFGRIRAVGLYMALLAGAATLVSWSPTDPGLWALDPYNAGREALDANDLPVAQRKLELAHSYVPQNPEVNLALGNLWLAKGDRERARAFYRDTLAEQTEHKSALNNLGVLALEDRDYMGAKVYLQRALRSDPSSAKSHYLMAQTLLGLGDRVAATQAVELALQLQPEQPEFLALRAELARQAP